MAILNKVQLAEILGFSERTLTEWQEEGMPIDRTGVRGQENAYDTAAVVAWMLDRAARKARADNPKDELYRSQKKLIDLNIAEKEHKLVDPTEVEAEYGRMVFAARTRLLQIVHRAGELEVLAGEEPKRAWLDTAILEALLGDGGHYLAHVGLDPLVGEGVFLFFHLGGQLASQVQFGLFADQGQTQLLAQGGAVREGEGEDQGEGGESHRLCPR